MTDATNASRTLLYNIHNGAWDGELLNILRVPRAMLPEVKDCAADFGVTEPNSWALPFPFWAWQVINRRPPSARPALNPA